MRTGVVGYTSEVGTDDDQARSLVEWRGQDLKDESESSGEVLKHSRSDKETKVEDVEETEPKIVGSIQLPIDGLPGRQSQRDPLFSDTDTETETVLSNESKALQSSRRHGGQDEGRDVQPEEGVGNNGDSEDIATETISDDMPAVSRMELMKGSDNEDEEYHYISDCEEDDGRSRRPVRGWNQLRVVDLKDELKFRGLKHSGKKSDLIARLNESDKQLGWV